MMKTLIEDARKVLETVGDGGFVRGLVVLQTKDGNFLTLTSGTVTKELDSAAEAACVALGKEPEE